MFFIIWRGWGFFAPLVLMGVTMLLSTQVDAYMGVVNYADDHRWIYSIGCLLGAVPCWFIGIKINRKPGQILQDVMTGQYIELKNIHSCFFIPFEYWAVIGILASVATLFIK